MKRSKLLAASAMALLAAVCGCYGGGLCPTCGSGGGYGAVYPGGGYTAPAYTTPPTNAYSAPAQVTTPSQPSAAATAPSGYDGSGSR